MQNKQIHMKPTLIQSSALALIAMAIMGLVLVLYSYLPLMRSQLQLQRWSACASAYRLEYSDTNNRTVVVSPNLTEVATCLTALQ